MQQLDSAAAFSLEMLMGERPEAWNTNNRSAWSRFIISLLMRTPAGVDAYKDAVAIKWTEDLPGLQERYEELKREDDPALFKDHPINTDPHVVAKATFHLFQKNIDNPILGKRFNNMLWRVVEFDHSLPSLLVSDTPVILELNSEKAHLALPVSPRHLFLATEREETMDALLTVNRKVMVKFSNLRVVQRAREFVGAADAKQRPFIEKHFGTQIEQNLTEALAEKYTSEKATNG